MDLAQKGLIRVFGSTLRRKRRGCLPARLPKAVEGMRRAAAGRFPCTESPEGPIMRAHALAWKT